MGWLISGVNWIGSLKKLIKPNNAANNIATITAVGFFNEAVVKIINLLFNYLG